MLFVSSYVFLTIMIIWIFLQKKSDYDDIAHEY